jgi:hypothetical protein
MHCLWAGMLRTEKVFILAGTDHAIAHFVLRVG